MADNFLLRPARHGDTREHVSFSPKQRATGGLLSSSFEALQVKSIARRGLRDWANVEEVLDIIHDYVHESSGVFYLPLGDEDGAPIMDHAGHLALTM